METKKVKKNTEVHSVGRRKESICTITFFKGEGENMVNGKKVEEYFTEQSHKALIMLPLIATNTLGHYHFTARVSGGGLVGQADALRLAIARSLSEAEPELHHILAKEGLLSRDPRVKERKKVFFVRARKRPQYSKR